MTTNATNNGGAGNSHNSDSESDNRELVMDEAGADGDEQQPPSTSSATTAEGAKKGEDAGEPSKSEINKEADLQEKHRLECLDNLEKIEKEFSDLKEKFFRDQMESLKAECEAIKLGSHEKFLEKVKELEEKKSEKVWAAQQWREYQLANINNMFDAEKRQCEEEYKLEKRQLRDRMLHTIEDKIKKLEDEKNTMSLIDGGDSRITRTLRRRKEPAARESQQTGQKRKLNPPHISYTLKESEILEDLAVIRGGRETKHGRLA